MVDHRKRLKYNPSDTCHLFLAIKRNKENGKDETYPKIVRRIIRHEDNDLKELRAICEELGGVWRIYKTVNARSFEKANKQFMHMLIDHLDEYYYRLDSLWKTCLLQKESKAEKKFLVDIDDKKRVTHVLKVFEENNINHVEFKITPNGYHYVVPAFDIRLLENIEKVEVLKDGYILIEVV